jgi:hypothetical protein
MDRGLIMDATVQEKIDAQTKFVKEKGYPYFAPQNGHCWNCRGQIYNSITLEEASTTLITGCPNCCRSYCD